MDFSHKKCIPCSGSEDPLSADKIATYMSAVPNWQHAKQDGMDTISRHLELKNFMAVIDLVNKIATVAEDRGHHPNLHLHDYKQLDIVVYTHKIGGLHENDFILAQQIEELLKE